jgi:hypothetical protein
MVRRKGVNESEDACRKRNGKKVPGRPIRPGLVLNPEGKNQFTYRRDFENTIGKLLSGEPTEDEAAAVPEWIRGIVASGMTRRRGPRDDRSTGRTARR